MSGRRREGTQLALISLTPLLVWRMYVGWILFPDWGAQAFWFNPENLGKPFAGILDLWTTIHRGQYFPDVPSLSRAGIFYPIILIGGFSVAVATAITRPSAVTLAALCYGIVALCLTYGSIWAHVSNGQRGTFELFVLLAVISVGIHAYPRGVKRSLVAFWIATGVYVFFGAFDAGDIRHAVSEFLRMLPTIPLSRPA